MASVENTDQTFGQLLAEGMRLKGLDYRTLAKLVGVSHGYLWQLVNAEKRAVNDPAAKRKRPSEAVTRQLADALDLDPRALLDAAGLTEVSSDNLLSGPTRYTSYPTTARQLYQDGLAAAAKGQPDRAIALLEAAVERGGVSFVNAHAGLGMAHFAAGRYTQAIREFDQAIKAAADEGDASIEAPDLHYNRGLAHQRLARQLQGADQALARRSAAADLRQAIALEGESQDLYHSAICYLFLESNHPQRVFPYGRAFLHRQATGPARHTTAALDIHLFLAYAYVATGQAAPGGPPQAAGHAMELVDLTMQLCPNYWFVHYVKAALLAQQAIGAPRRRTAATNAGLTHVRKALQLNPSAQGHFRGELAGDFKNWANDTGFRELLAAPNVDSLPGKPGPGPGESREMAK